MGIRLEKVVLELDDSGWSTKMARDAAVVSVLNKELDKLGKHGSKVGRQFDTMAGKIGKGEQSLRGMNSELDRTNLGVDAVASMHLPRLSSSADRADTSINQLTGRLRLFADVAAILGPGLVPIGAVGIPAVTGLANQLGVAAVAGGVAIAAFQGVGDALKSVNDAALEPTQANLEKARDAMERLSPAAQNFVLKLQDLRPALAGIRDTAAEGMFPGLTEGIEALETRIPEVERIVANFSETLGDMLSGGGDSLASSRWDEFFDFLATEAAGTLADLGSIVGDLTHGLAEMWQAFDPLNDDFSDWMVRVADSFDGWATGLAQTEGFADFMAYIRDTGPQVADTMGALGDAILQIVEAASPLGGPVLKALEAVAEVIAAVADSDLGTPIMAGVTALALYNRALATTAALQARMAASGGMFGLGAMGQGAKSGVGSAKTSIKSLNADLGLLARNFLTAGAASERMAAQSATARKRIGQVAGPAAKTAGVVGGLAVATTGVADGMGLSNSASLALMGTIAGPWGAAIGGGAGLMMDFAAANDDAEDAIKRAAAAAGNSTSFRQMSDAVAAAKTELDEFREHLAGATTPGAEYDFGRDLGAIKNWFEGLFGDSDVEELERKTAKIEHSMGILRFIGKSLAKDLGAGTMTTIVPGLEQVVVSTEEMEAAMTRALPVAQRLFPEIVSSFADMENLHPDQLTQIVAEIQRLDSEKGRVEALGLAFKGLDSDLMATADAAGALRTALDSLIQPELDQERAMLAWKASIRNLNEDLAENSRSLSVNTNEGQQNREAVLDRVDALLETVTADAAAGHSSEFLARKLKIGRRAILDAADAAGLNRGEVEKMIDQMKLTPGNIKTVVELLGDDTAKQKIKGVWTHLENLDGKTARTRIENTTVNTMIFRQIGNGSTVKVAGQPFPRADGGTIPRFADGGEVAGSRFPYRDSVIARVKGGGIIALAGTEEVITNRNGEADAFRRDRAAGRIPAYADGGTVARDFERRYVPSASPSMHVTADVSALQAEISAMRAAQQRTNELLAIAPRATGAAIKRGIDNLAGDAARKGY